MQMWRCPHCGTPQAESSRCWVCKRSSTSCGTCRHFRRAIAGQLGYCGLDRRRLPLVGDEMRGCWAAMPGLVDVPPSSRPATSGPRTDDRPRIDFVLLDAIADPVPAVDVIPETPAGPAPSPPAPDPIFGFWGEEV